MINFKDFFLILLLFSGILISCNENNEQDTNDNGKLSDTLSELEGNWEGCMVSAYIFQEDGRYLPDSSIKMIKDFEKLIDHQVGSVMWYPAFADPFPAKQCKEIKELGMIPHLTWEFFFPDSAGYNTMPTEGSYYLTDEVLEGKYDLYIKQFAEDAKSLGSKVFIRFLHEFNGNWYLWSGNKNGRENGGHEKVVALWKYVVDKFREIGANNVKWIWNPHGPSIDVSEEEWNNIENYWPGDDYVDWIGMDAYNWYPKDPWGSERPYRDFDNCFGELYERCIKLGNQPIMIAEFATPEFEYKGITKPDWIKDAMTKIKTEYPRIKMFVWFHINKESDWRVNSSPESLQAFIEAVSDDYFSAKP